MARTGDRGGIDEYQLAMFRTRLAEQEVAYPGYRQAWEQLTHAVLRHGGQHVVPPIVPERLIGVLLAEATAVDGALASMRYGAPNDCHRNAASLWREGACDAIGTGYALSPDGLWREHSWGLQGGRSSRRPNLGASTSASSCPAIEHEGSPTGSLHTTVPSPSRVFGIHRRCEGTDAAPR